MPVYTNGNETSSPFPGLGGVFVAGATVTVPRYVNPIPAGWTLTSDNGTQTPNQTILDAAISATVLDGLAVWDQLLITNNSGASLNVHVNGDTTNTDGANLVTLIAGQSLTLDNKRDRYGWRQYGSLSFSGAGTGHVIVVGFLCYDQQRY